MWVNRGPELPFMPKRAFEAWSGDKVVSWRADKYPRADLLESPEPGECSELLTRTDNTPSLGAPADRCVMPVMRALLSGQLRAVIQLQYGFQPIPKEMWAPDESGEWPIAWLYGRLEEAPFGSGISRQLSEPYRDATVMFLDYEVKIWAASADGEPKLPAERDGYVAIEDVESWMRSIGSEQYSGQILQTMARKRFWPLAVRPYHVKKARLTVEAAGRKSGPRGRQVEA